MVSATISIDDERLWDILFEEACVEGQQAERIHKRLEEICGDRWIPVDPENIPDAEVLCCDEYGEELIGYLSNTAEGWVCESDECVMYYVVAWKPKPDPYRKEGE